MRGNDRLVRSLLATGGAAAMLLLVAAPSWAPHVAQLQVTPAQARPGQEVSVYGPRGYGPTNPVEVRWGSPTGPVLGTFQPNTESYAQWGPGTITIPADAKAGTYQLFATQNLTPGETYIRGIPSQASIQVVSATGAAAGPLRAAARRRRGPAGHRPRRGGGDQHRQPGAAGTRGRRRRPVPRAAAPRSSSPAGRRRRLRRSRPSEAPLARSRPRRPPGRPGHRLRRRRRPG